MTQVKESNYKNETEDEIGSDFILNVTTKHIQ